MVASVQSTHVSTDLQEGGYDGTNAQRNQVVSSQTGGGFGT